MATLHGGGNMDQELHQILCTRQSNLFILKCWSVYVCMSVFECILKSVCVCVYECLCGFFVCVCLCVREWNSNPHTNTSEIRTTTNLQEVVLQSSAHTEFTSHWVMLQPYVTTHTHTHTHTEPQTHTHTHRQSHKNTHT